MSPCSTTSRRSRARLGEWHCRSCGQANAAKLNADHSDYQDPCLPCECGGKARFAGRPSKTFTTALGAMTLKRAWHHCDGCHNGFSPRDRALGMEDTFLSPAALRMIVIAAGKTGFEGSSDLLRELACLAVAPTTVERDAEALGREIASDEYRVIDLELGDAPTLYLGLDGTGVPAHQSEVAGREGKQPDGTAKTREFKLAVVWSAETADKDGRPVRDPGSTTHNAAIETIACRDTDAELAPFARGPAPRLRHCSEQDPARRRRAMDMELRRRALPRCHLDGDYVGKYRSLPARGTSVAQCSKCVQAT